MVGPQGFPRASGLGTAEWGKAGGLDFDHVGTESSQDTADKGPERICHVQGVYAFERSLGMLRVGCHYIDSIVPANVRLSYTNNSRMGMDQPGITSSPSRTSASVRIVMSLRAR